MQMLRRTSILSLTAAIPSGETAHLVATPNTAFRPERFVFSPSSFSLSLTRRAWTWPLIAIGSVLGRALNGFARLLRVDLHASHLRREYTSVEYAMTHPDEVRWGDDGDDDDERPFVLITAPVSRRGRLLASLGKVFDRLAQVRLSWQQAQLGSLIVRDVKISANSHFAHGTNGIPADMLTDLTFSTTCMPDTKIEIVVHNMNRRGCRLVMAIIGTSLIEASPEQPT
jgi:hypothetical protein